MSDIKSQAIEIEPNCSSQDIHELIKDTDNIYHTLAVIAKRAKQVSVDLKHELHTKLEEFAVTSDTIEEIHENSEQIALSKHYEVLANPVLIATDEFKNGRIHYHTKEARTEVE